MTTKPQIGYIKSDIDTLALNDEETLDDPSQDNNEANNNDQPIYDEKKVRFK